MNMKNLTSRILKPIIFLSSLLCFPIFIFAQNEEVLKEIDEQIWEPFVKSYNNLDYKTFNSIHSEEVLRITSREIRKADAYKAKNEKYFKRSKEEGRQQSISFQFEKRVVTGDKAFEAGYYEIKIKQPNGEEGTYYARFHVVLQKENNQWKIVQDWDSGSLNGVKVTAKDFYRLKALNEKKLKPEPSYTTMDFVKILNGNRDEALFYYENNWKQLRKQALEKNYITSYQLLLSEEDKDYDFILITEYGNQDQYDNKEKNFGKLIERQGGVKLLNDIPSSEFRKIVRDNTLKSY